MPSSSTGLLLRVCVFVPLRLLSMTSLQVPVFKKYLTECYSFWPIHTAFKVALKLQAWKSFTKLHHHLPADFRLVTLSTDVSFLG